MERLVCCILCLLAAGVAHGQDLREEGWPSSSFDHERIRDLPLPRNAWGIVENLDPSSVTSRFDEGGLRTGIIPFVGVLAGSAVQNAFRFDGINITNPYDPGRPLLYPDWGSIGEFRISAAAHPARLRAPGATFSTVPRRGGGDRHGEFELSYLGEPFQNESSEAERFNRFGEGRFLMGGAAPRYQRWGWLVSLGMQRLTRIVPGFAAIPTTSVYSGLMRADGPVRARNEFGALITAQIVNVSHLGAREGVTPPATLYANDRYEVVQGHWTRRQSAETVGHVRFGFSHASPTDTFQAGVMDPARIRLFTGEVSGAAPLESDFALSRFSLNGGLELTRKGAFGHHEIEAGFEMERSLATEENRIVGDIQMLLYPGDAPALVAEYNTPSRTKQRLQELSVFLQDHLRMGRVSIRGGVNLDSSVAWLPRQSSGPRGFWPRQDVPRQDVVSWTTLSPRLGVAFPFRLLRSAARVFASFSRYYDLLPARYANFSNPNSVGGRLFEWRDANDDGNFQPGEAGALLRAFGGPYSSVDPHLRRPYTNEWVVGLDRKLGRYGDVSVFAVRRDNRRRVETVNTGVPPSAFTPVEVADPGGDGAFGTADDQTLTVYNQAPHTLGQDRFLLTNPPGLSSRYEALQAVLRLRGAGPVFWDVSFTAMRGVAKTGPGNNADENDPGMIGSLYDDPNSLINARGRVFYDRAYIGKMAGEVRAPMGLRLSSVIRYLDGLPFGRRLTVTGFNQGPFFVMATPRGQPGGHRTQFNLAFDQRIGREFEWGKSRLFLSADIFNLLNMSRNLREADLTGLDFQDRRPLKTQNPRVFRMSLRIGW